MNVPVAVSESYQKAVSYRSYRLIHLYRKNDEVASETREMLNRVAIQRRERAMNGKGSISVITFLM